MLDPSDLQFLIDLVKKEAGIVLTAEKEYLLDTRLMPVARKAGHQDITGLTQLLRTASTKELVTEVIEAMTTNETSFFRDIKPFNQLRDKVMPVVLKYKKPGDTVRIWSAAASTGQEAYSVAMQLLEMPQMQGINIEILATDLDHHVLDKAKDAVYSQFDVQRGMPVPLLLRYFKQEGDMWRLTDQIRNMVTFESKNLLRDIGPSLGAFDIIFCRNVLIYFDVETKSKVLQDLYARLHPHGFLFLGASESMLGTNVPMEAFDAETGLFCMKKDMEALQQGLSS